MGCLPWRHDAPRLGATMLVISQEGLIKACLPCLLVWFLCLDSASVGLALDSVWLKLFVPTTWFALNHNPKRTACEHNPAELRESESHSPLPDGHVGVETAWGRRRFPQQSNIYLHDIHSRSSNR